MAGYYLKVAVFAVFAIFLAREKMEMREQKTKLGEGCKKSSVVQDLETKNLLTEGKWKTEKMVEGGVGIINIQRRVKECNGILFGLMWEESDRFQIRTVHNVQ